MHIAPSESFCQETAKQWVEENRKHRTSPKNISSGRAGEFVLANEYPALHQSNKSVNEHHTRSYPQYIFCFAIRGAKGNVQWMYKET